MIVTDVKWNSKGGDPRTGFYMDKWLRENLDDIPHFLGKAWDCVGVVSGHGKVRIGKSTMAMQVCYYLAWLLAGGKMIVNEKGQATEYISPKEPVRFSLEENVVFSAEDLQQRATKLYEKYGKNQVLLYDEGRQGLDSSRAMESINKGMEDFFQECGFMGHVIIIVLPNFFKLHEDYAVARSLFLIDVFADKKFNRGFFSFFNELQKEKLFFFGKKRIGVSMRYAAADSNFWGKFTGWMPFDKDQYELLKKEAMVKKREGRFDKRFKLQRDIALFILHEDLKLSYQEIKTAFERVGNIKLGDDAIKTGLISIRNLMDKR